MTEKEKELIEKRREALYQITERYKNEEGPIDFDRYERECKGVYLHYQYQIDDERTIEQPEIEK